MITVNYKIEVLGMILEAMGAKCERVEMYYGSFPEPIVRAKLFDGAEWKWIETEIRHSDNMESTALRLIDLLTKPA